MSAQDLPHRFTERASSIDELTRGIDSLLEIRVSDRLRHYQVNMPAKECFECIGEIEEKCAPGAEGLAAKIHHKIQVTRSRPKRPGDRRANNLQAFDVKSHQYFCGK